MRLIKTGVKRFVKNMDLKSNKAELKTPEEIIKQVLNKRRKNKYKFLLFLIAIIFMIIFISTFEKDRTTNQKVTDCNELNITNEGYILENDVTSTGTCFNITKNNVTIDCKGHKITYNSDSGDYEYAVYSKFDSTTIKNCIIEEGHIGGNPNPAIRYNSNINGIIDNNNITTIGHVSYGIVLENSENNKVSNNVLNISGVQSMGVVVISKSNNNYIFNNVIKGSGEKYFFGIDVSINSNYNKVTDNSIVATGGYGIGIDTWTNSNYNIISNNIIKTSGKDYSYGLYSYGSSNNTFSDNIIVASGNNSYGIFIDSSSGLNTISGNKITASRVRGHKIYFESD